MDIWPVPTDHTRDVRRRPQSESAWRHWFAFVYPRVYYTLYRITGGDDERTADLTQGAIERFLRYRALDRVTTDADSIAYLVHTAQRMHVDLLRKSRAERGAHEAVHVAAHEQVLAAEDEASKVLDLERLTNRLDEPDRRLIGWLLAGRSLGQIAQRLGISYSAAATRVHRVKARLRKISEGA